MIQKIVPVAISITLIGSANLAAYADNMLDKDYIVREIWSDWWHGKGDDGFIFPEASYKHHILTEWVNDNYGDDNYDWSKIGQLNYNFKDYYDELTGDWNFNDDRDGNWTIITITATTNLRVSISSGQRNIVLNVCRQKQIKAESTFILTSVSLNAKKKNGKSGTKCVLLILNMHLR